jgi:hypothetical protein
MFAPSTPRGGGAVTRPLSWLGPEDGVVFGAGVASQPL